MVNYLINKDLAVSFLIDLEQQVLRYLFFFWSGHGGSKAYSLWGGVVPSPSIGYDYL